MKKRGLISLIIGIVVTLGFLFIPPFKIPVMMNILVAELLIAVVGIVLGSIGIKESKKLSITAIVINSILAVLLLFSMLGLETFKQLENCELSDNNMATCELNGIKIENIPKEYIDEDQMKE